MDGGCCGRPTICPTFAAAPTGHSTRRWEFFAECHRLGTLHAFAPPHKSSSGAVRMAEIHIQHKQRRRLWPWLLLLAIPLIWLLTRMRGHDDVARGPADSAAVVGTSPAGTNGSAAGTVGTPGGA